MSEPKLTQDTAGSPDHPRKASYLRRTLPYVAVLTLAIVGVAYTNISHQSLAGFWEFWLSRSELSASPRNGLTLTTGKLAFG